MSGGNELELNDPVQQKASGSGEEEDDDVEEEFVVEKILKHRTTKKGTIEYFLKWKGFPNEENTWEPAENLNCPDLIDAYKKLQEDKSDKKKVKGTTSTKTHSENEAKVNGIESDEKKKKKKHSTDEA